jgi:hypothetical protein
MDISPLRQRYEELKQQIHIHNRRFDIRHSPREW